MEGHLCFYDQSTFERKQHCDEISNKIMFCSGLVLIPCAEVTTSLELIPAPHPPLWED